MKREAIRVLIIDGQGGGMGRGLVEAVKKRWPALHLRAVGTTPWQRLPCCGRGPTRGPPEKTQ